jgi:hypothetical protein
MAPLQQLQMQMYYQQDQELIQIQVMLPLLQKQIFLLQVNKVDIEIGNVTTKANATAIVTTNRQNLSTGTVTIKQMLSTYQ